MKKVQKAFLILFCLVIYSGSALAGGLNGLIVPSEPATTGIEGLVGSQVSTQLPDPAAVLGTTGTVFAENYEFITGYFCTVYSYPTPNSETKFVNEYSAAAKEAGYTVASSSIPEMSGLSGYSVQNGMGKTAYIALGVQGDKLFLMVENGMDFTPQEKVNYIAFTLNGETIELPYSFTLNINNRSLYFTGDLGHSGYNDVQLSLPDVYQAGSTFYADRGSYVSGFEIYVNKGYREIDLLHERPKDYSARDNMFYREDALTGDGDFVYLTIDFLEETSSTIHIKGTLEGSFYDGELTIADGCFNVIFEK